MRSPHIVDGHFWLRKSEFTAADIDRTKKQLTLTGIKGRKLDPFLHYAYAESGAFLQIPRAFGLRYIDASNIDDRRTENPVDINFKAELRPNQIDPMDRMERELLRGPVHGAVLEGKAGSGKTVMSLYLVSRVKQKTIILAHTDFLMDQWCQEIEEKLGEKAGRVVRNEFDWHDRKVVVAMVQTLVARKYPDEFYRSFGFLVEDECHHAPAETFTQSIGSFPAKFRCGVSATPDRGDKLQQLIFWHLGKHAATVIGGQEKITVCRIKTGVTIFDSDFTFPWDATINRGKLITHLGRLRSRNDLIIDKIIEAASNGRKMIVFSERKEHLERLYAMLEEARESGRAPSDLDFGYYWGGMKKADRERSSLGNVLLSTYQFAKEAMNLPLLDFLIMASPVGDIRQPFGRIARILKGKKKPIALDFRDSSEYLNRMGSKRDSQYRALGYEVIDIAST